MTSLSDSPDWVTTLQQFLPYCRKMKPGDAEDLMQETALRFIKRLQDRNLNADLANSDCRIDRGVVFRGIQQSAADMWRKECRQIVGVSLDREVDSKESMEESFRRAGDLLAPLPPELRRILHMKDVEGRTNREIARLLSLDIEAVKSRVNRARARLRRYYDTEGIER